MKNLILGAFAAVLALFASFETEAATANVVVVNAAERWGGTILCEVPYTLDAFFCKEGKIYAIRKKDKEDRHGVDILMTLVENTWEPVINVPPIPWGDYYNYEDYLNLSACYDGANIIVCSDFGIYTLPARISEPSELNGKMWTNIDDERNERAGFLLSNGNGTIYSYSFVNHRHYLNKNDIGRISKLNTLYMYKGIGWQLLKTNIILEDIKNPYGYIRSACCDKDGNVYAICEYQQDSGDRIYGEILVRYNDNKEEWSEFKNTIRKDLNNICSDGENVYATTKKQLLKFNGIDNWTTIADLPDDENFCRRSLISDGNSVYAVVAGANRETYYLMKKFTPIELPSPTVVKTTRYISEEL